MKPEVPKSWTLEMDYSRAPCLGADQKTRGFWERDWAEGAAEQRVVVENTREVMYQFLEEKLKIENPARK